MKRDCFLTFMLVFAVSARIAAFAQAPAQSPIPEPNASQSRMIDTGYLAGKEPGFLDILPPYPVLNSLQDGADVTTLWRWQHPDNSRWKLANADEDMSYNRFSEAFGMEINATTPLLIHLLDRAERDVQSVAFTAKTFYNRPRPFQRFQLAQVCGEERVPAPDVPMQGGSSYPSGHASFGWAVALILAEVTPKRSQQLLARGQEYGESRVVCAMHYPSDVAGGQLVATAVVARLNADPEFNQDLNCVRQEHAAALKTGESLTPACQRRKAQLASKE